MSSLIPLRDSRPTIGDDRSTRRSSRIFVSSSRGLAFTSISCRAGHTFGARDACRGRFRRSWRTRADASSFVVSDARARRASGGSRRVPPRRVAEEASSSPSSRVSTRAVEDASAGDAAAADPPPPPWAALSVPVYSLATAPDATGETAGDSAPRPSMNITTYCCPVTIKPTRRMAVALYTHTATARNMLATGKGVLQVLRKQHAELVPLLGKSSAHDVDKLAALEEAGFETTTRHGVPTLTDAAGVVALELVSLETAGDHHLALCEVVAYDTFEGEGEPLYTADLPK